MIEQRTACLERRCHAHPVYLSKDIARQVGLAVEVKQILDSVIGCGKARDLAIEFFAPGKAAVHLIPRFGGVELSFSRTVKMRNTVDIPPCRIERNIKEVVFAAGTVRQSLAQRPYKILPDRTGQFFEPAPVLIGDIARITGEQFVAAVT